MALSNAMLQGKLKGTQCSETVKSRVSIIIIIMICMKLRFSSCLRAKAGRWGHKALPKYSPAVNWQHRRAFSQKVATVTEREANHYLGF